MIVTRARNRATQETLVVLAFETMPWSSSHVRIKHWVGKENMTFSDMISSVRRYL